MARSSYIYTVIYPAPQNCDPPHVIACFTVRHEAVTWCRTCDRPELDSCEVWRFPDNPPVGESDYSRDHCCGSVEKFVEDYR